MNSARFAIVVLIAFLAGILGSYVWSSASPGGASSSSETAYDRVLRTGVLRCGYADWPPTVFVKDPTTGKISGILPDVTEAIAGKMGLKVQWTENTGWGTFIESLRTHRIDAFCAGGWRNADRGRYAIFTDPIFYNVVYAYVPVDEHRFDKGLSAVNDPGIRISTMDGEVSDTIAREHFPEAAKVSVPQLGQVTDILMNLATGKADIVFTEAFFVDDFIKSNPGKIRRLQDVPYQVFQSSLILGIHETALRDMLDSALAQLQNEGVIEEILLKYKVDPKVFLRPALPYR